MAEEETAAAAPEATPKKPRKPRKPRAPKSLSDVEVELVDDDEPDEARSPHRVEHDGVTITLTGTECTLRVMTLEEQKAHGIKTIAGEMGKKCKTPLVLTFKNAKAAIAFFDMCLHAEKPQEEMISVSGKVNWYSPTMVISL